MTERADRDFVQLAVWRLYRRHGVRGIAVGCIAFDIAAGLGSAVIAAAWGKRYIQVSTPKFIEMAVLALFYISVPVAIAGWLGRSRYRAALSWSGAGKTRDRAPEIWRIAVRIPGDLALRLLVIFVTNLMPVAVGAILFWNAPARDLIPIVLVGTVGGLAAISVVVFGTAVALRPLLEDIAGYLPEEFEPPVTRSRARTTAGAPLAAVALACAVTVAAYADLARGPWKLALACGIGVISLVIGGMVFWAVMRTLLNPLDDLLQATRRVRAGDLTTPVPIVTDDELGTVAHGFNQMLATVRRHEQELRDSRARVVAAADQARRKVERDLHDGAQQQLVLIGLKLGVARRQVQTDPAGAGEALGELQADLARALTELRDLAHGIYPALLESDGLPSALRDAAGRAAIPTEVNVDGAGRYQPDIEAAVYFCCLEALQNAGKHAGPGASAKISLTEHADALSFEIADTGRGFELNGRPAGAGLENMADRIAALGGSLVVSSRPGTGTSVSGTVPLSDREQASLRT